MNKMMRAQKIVGALKDDPDWSKIIDERFLPDDLKTKDAVTAVTEAARRAARRHARLSGTRRRARSGRSGRSTSI